MKSILVLIITLFSLNNFSYAAVLGDCTNNNIVDVSDIVCTVNIILNPVENTDALCSDGGDNDFDGNTDCADSDCTSALPCLIEVCDDGIDNDLDEAIDCGDSDCERDAACAVSCASDADCSGATPTCNLATNLCQ